MDRVLRETERNRQLANQIAYRAFTAHGVNDGKSLSGSEVCFHLTMDKTFFINFNLTFNCTTVMF